MSVFEKYESDAYPFEFAGTLLVDRIAGGIPSDPKKAEAHIRSKVQVSDHVIQELVKQTMKDREIPADEAVEAVAELSHLNGFRRDDRGLYIGGYQLKAALKEAASVAASVGKIPSGTNYGTTQWKKGLKGFLPEHIVVLEDRLYLGVSERSSVEQRFVHTRNGSGIQYEETVADAKIDFTIRADYDFGEKWWAMVWLTGQEQGIGATRSQGYGRYTVVRWDRVR
jgi:hypothetical protein